MLGVAQPAALLQMSAIEAPRPNPQEEVTPLVECTLTSRGHGKCRTIASTIQWASVTCLDMDYVHVLLLCKSLTVWAHVGENIQTFYGLRMA